MQRRWLHTLMLGLSLALFGCGEDAECKCADSSVDAGLTQTAVMKIGPKGGFVQHESGAKVEIPEGALKAEITVQIAEIPNPPPFKAGREKAGKAFAFTPHGTQFEKEVTVTVPFESDEKAVHLTKLDDDQDVTWTQVDSAPKEKLLVGTSKSFSIYCAARFTTTDAGTEDASAALDGGN